MDFSAGYHRHVATVERGIEHLLPPASTRPARLHEAMRYSMQAGGKRLRPVLVLATAEMFGATADAALPAAVAIECLHTYSLIHDDLPCMDNDDLRRGRPTAHRAFDEATALLAGDALLTHAFALLGEGYAAQPALATRLLRELSDAAGSRRLIGGQMEDLLGEKKPAIATSDLEFIHLQKTAAMIEAALVMGAHVGGATPEDVEHLRRTGRHLGLAFQIIDDILDATAATETLGKTAGKDAKSGKSTFVSVHGLQAAQALAAAQTAAALAACDRIGRRNSFMVAMIESLGRRQK
jgi:geranylgeranyl pyrophosphate synthase